MQHAQDQQIPQEEGDKILQANRRRAFIKKLLLQISSDTAHHSPPSFHLRYTLPYPAILHDALLTSAKQINGRHQQILMCSPGARPVPRPAADVEAPAAFVSFRLAPAGLLLSALLSCSTADELGGSFSLHMSHILNQNSMAKP